MLVKVRPSLAMMAMGLALVACVKSSSNNSSGGSPAVPTGEDPVSIKIIPVSPSVEAGGGTKQLGVQAVYSNGAVEYLNEKNADSTASVAWTSATATIATVDAATGLLTGVATGTTTVTAQYKNKTATDTVSVTPRVTAIQVFAPKISVGKTQTASYSVVALFEDNTAAQVTPDAFATGDVSIATATASDVTGVDNGTTSTDTKTTTLTITYHQRVATAQVTVTAKVAAPTVTGITIEGPAKIAQGTSGSFTAKATYSDLSTADVSSDVAWKSSDDTVVTIDETGALAPQAVGSAPKSATITATLTVAANPGSPFTASQAIEVQANAMKVASLEMVPATVTVGTETRNLTQLPFDAEASFSVTGHFSDGTNTYDQDLTADVTWSVPNNDTCAGSPCQAGIPRAAIGDPGVVTTMTGTPIVGYPGAVTVTAKYPNPADSKNPFKAVYPLTIGGQLDHLVITVDPATISLAGETSPQFTATGIYKDGATTLDYTADLTDRVSWFDAQTLADEPPFIVVDNTPGDNGVGFPLAEGTTTVSAFFHGFLIQWVLNAPDAGHPDGWDITDPASFHLTPLTALSATGELAGVAVGP